MDSIPYAKIADIDFSKPKSTIAPMKRGAHCNNDREMLSDPSEIEVSSSKPSSRGQSITGSLNPNIVPTTEQEATLFLIMLLVIIQQFHHCCQHTVIRLFLLGRTMICH